MADFSSTRIAFVRRRFSRAAGGLAVAAAVLPLLAYGLLSGVGAGASLVNAALGTLDLAVPAALLFALVSFVSGRDLVGMTGTLRCEDDHLVIGRGRWVRRIPLSRVQGGIVAPQRDGVSAELHLEGGDRITARVADVASARALLTALRVDVASQRCRVELTDRGAVMVLSTFAPLGLMYFAFIAAVASRWSQPASVSLALAVGLYALAAGALRALLGLPDVTIGTDGIAFRRWLREKFVPFADFASVRISAWGLRIVRRDGRPLDVRSVTGVSPARFAALVARIDEAKAARDAAPHQALAQLDRAGRGVSEWRASLAALARRGLDYRGAGLLAEDLEAELASPDVTAERRLGAAVALSASKHPAAPDRIRIAAAQCASERLRIALEKVSLGEEDDEVLADALDDPGLRRRV